MKMERKRVAWLTGLALLATSTASQAIFDDGEWGDGYGDGFGDGFGGVYEISTDFGFEHWAFGVSAEGPQYFVYESPLGLSTNLYAQGFWFSIDGGAATPVYIQGLDSVSVSPSGDAMTMSYGGTTDLSVDITYSIQANDFRSARVDESVTFTNLGPQAVDLTWFAYTDWDLNGDAIDQSVTGIFGGLVQRDFDGTTGTVAIVDDGGADETHWEVAEFDDLVTRFDNGDPTDDQLADTMPVNGGPLDYTFAYQFDYTAVQPGESITFSLAKFLELGSLSTPFDPILPPSETGPFFFDFPVWPDDTFWVDPVVAVGYEYINTGGPNFASVTVPGPAVGLGSIGDDLFGIYLYDSVAGDYASTPVAILDGADPTGNTFDFTTIDPTGVERFLIADIEPSAGLDPDDPTAFVTGLTFVGSGIANFTMDPVTYSVPAPMTAWLMSAALLGLAMGRRKRYG